MKEQYFLLTGEHSGIGLALTKKLIKPENKLGLLIRNESRKQEAISILLAESCN